MRAIVLLLAAALCCGSVHAAVPRQINYQGYLTNAGGAPVDATVQMELKLYNVAAEGSALHSETQTVAVTSGVFNVLLGAQPANPLTLPFDVPYWLGVKVGSDAEMAPRQPVAAAGYAIRAASAEVLAPGAIVPGSQIADGTVAAAKLASSGCASGQILKYNGSNWACAADGIGDLGCQTAQIIIWDGTAGAWQCADIGGFNWDISYPGGIVDFVPEQFGTMILPAGTTMFFDPNTSTFSGNVSACGVGGFFLVISADNGWHVADLSYSNGASGPNPAGWSVFSFGGTQDGVLQQPTALSWRAGCYTNIIGPVPPFSARIVFNKAFPTGKKYQ